MFPEVRLLKPCGSCCRHFFCQNVLSRKSLRIFWNQTVVYRSFRSRISLHKGCIHIPAGRCSGCHMMKGILLSRFLQRKRKRAYAEAVADPLITVLKSCTVLCFSHCAYMSFTNIYIDSICFYHLKSPLWKYIPAYRIIVQTLLDCRVPERFSIAKKEISLRSFQIF